MAWLRSTGDPRTQVFRALACEHRINILEMLIEGEKSTKEISSKIKIHPSVLSRHLGTLQSAGLVEVRKEGVEAFWSVSMPEVKELLEKAKSIVKKVDISVSSF